MMRRRPAIAKRSVFVAVPDQRCITSCRTAS